MTDHTAPANQESDSVTGPAYSAWPNRETAEVYKHLAGGLVEVKHVTQTAARHLADTDRMEAARRTGDDARAYATSQLRGALRRNVHEGEPLATALGEAALERVSWQTIGLAFVWRAEQGMDDPEPDDTW